MRVSIDTGEQRNRCILLHIQGNTNNVCITPLLYTQVVAQFQLVAIVTVAITLHVHSYYIALILASSHSTFEVFLGM